MTKRRAALVLFALTCAACTPSRNALPPSAEDGEIRAADAVQYESAHAVEAEAVVLALAKGAARRESNTLILTREDGRRVELVDARPCRPEGDDTQCTSYLLAAWLPSRHAFLVDVLRYEGGHYLLIDARSGERLEIASPPHFSPDGTRFATFDNDEENDADGIRIWVAHGQSFVSEWNLQHVADFVRWDGDNRLLVKLEPPPGERRAAGDGPAAIVRSGAGWKLEREGRTP